MEVQEEVIRNQTTQTKLLVDGLKDMIKEIMKWTVQIFVINFLCGQDQVVLGCNFVFFGSVIHFSKQVGGFNCHVIRI